MQYCMKYSYTSFETEASIGLAGNWACNPYVLKRLALFLGILGLLS